MSLQNVKFLCKLGWIDKVKKLLRNFIGKLSAGEMTLESKKNLETPKRLLHEYCCTVILSSCPTFFFLLDFRCRTIHWKREIYIKSKRIFLVPAQGGCGFNDELPERERNPFQALEAPEYI